MHRQLYGRWSVARAGTHTVSTRTLRLALRTDSVAALLWSATDVRVLEDAGLAAHPYLRKRGPDVLNAATTADVVHARLLDKRFARRSSWIRPSSPESGTTSAPGSCGALGSTPQLVPRI